MRLLLTRPRADSDDLAKELSQRGIESLINPLLDIELEPEKLPRADDWQAVLVTSRNGARALAKSSLVKSTPIIAVGDATAEALVHVGFMAVKSAAGDANDLLALARTHLNPSAGPVLHVSGDRIALDLANALSAGGFECVRAALYRTRETTAFDPETEAALRQHAVDGVLLFSPRTAELFATLVIRGELDGTTHRLTAFCISEAVAEAARAVDWKAVYVAKCPDKNALLSLVEAAKS
ncbi:MAG: uroporphyrinogen-III synthase [Rhodospirillaceae bacterium]|jgi:uroporphyrinogen-III synthase|nr:uroporphyrinogen-III synthase [Rhodospirillaceae bacterium]MBT6138446.1 uroporphyrinogen-III synthase [Rhodospirillaceae bacterium]MBT7028756.1 uroporphyrinogen-III synthase [Verrucomicrobiota bacterium]